MIKTTTLTESTSRHKTKKAKKISVLADDFGPSHFTIQTILNYSKSLQVIRLSHTEPFLGTKN
ncbi:MAG: hypothetical protein JST67_07840 [Bacteroidetes bacterium]|nr:hypothetical protein [Bacteroidota bacterium]